MKKHIETLGNIILIIVCAMPVLFVLYIVVGLASYGAVYETNDVSDYGKIIGNYDNESPKEFIFSFFPSELDSSFSDVTYHYWAKKGDAYAYECFLEFTIEDKQTYDRFVEQYVNSEKMQPFSYDSNFMEYSVSNVFDMDWSSLNDKGGYPIDYANVGKILCWEERKKICFFALGTYDGGGTDTAELDYFFNKFNIDVIDYQMNAYLEHADQDKGLTCKMKYEQGQPLVHPYPYP